MLVIVDAGRSHVRPAATWFASPIVEQAIGPGLEHPYDHDLPGLVETTLERGRSAVPAPRRRLGGGSADCASGWARRRRGGTHGRGMGRLCAGLGDRLPGAHPARPRARRARRGLARPRRPFTRPDLDTVRRTGRPGRPGARALGADRGGIDRAPATRPLLKRAAEDTAALPRDRPTSSGRWWSTPCAWSQADHASLSTVQPGSGRLVDGVSAGTDVGRPRPTPP